MDQPETQGPQQSNDSFVSKVSNMFGTAKETLSGLTTPNSQSPTTVSNPYTSQPGLNPSAKPFFPEAPEASRQSGTNPYAKEYVPGVKLTQNGGRRRSKRNRSKRNRSKQNKSRRKRNKSKRRNKSRRYTDQIEK